jgi:hypothetical protein
MRAPYAASVAAATRRNIAAAATGWRPMAPSADSIPASVPFNTAFATSATSARVGRSCWTIDSSICVAVIAGRPLELAAAMIRFCTSGICARSVSTPRSPRATMTASAAAAISSSFASARRFSILATRSGAPASGIQARTRTKSSVL